MKNNQKGFIVTLIAIVIILAVGGLFWYSKINKIVPSYIPKSSYSTDSKAAWKTEKNTQYNYQISYQPAEVLAAEKIRPEINVGGVGSNAYAACENAKQNSDTQHIKINGIDFDFLPLVADRSEFFVVQYTTTRNNLCYQILFYAGDKNYPLTSLEQQNAVHLYGQIIESFKFTK